MQITVPPLTEPVLLTDYNPAMLLPGTDQPVVVHVWVNPPRALLAEHAVLVDAWTAGKAEGATGRPAMAAAEAALAGWYARLWSQGPDAATHWTVEDVQALAALDTDPALYAWLTRRTWEAISAHRAGRKKTSASR